jgi:Ca2+-binding RTX toxin-like protein
MRRALYASRAQTDKMGESVSLGFDLQVAISFSGTPAAISITMRETTNIGVGRAVFAGLTGAVTFTGIENLILGEGADTVLADDGSNVIQGNGGDDDLQGYDGNDRNRRGGARPGRRGGRS